MTADGESQPKDRGGNWILDILRPTLERAAREQAAAEEHARTCTDRPCERCERFVCKCGVIVDRSRECQLCVDRRALAFHTKPTRDSIPERFRWAMDATMDLLASRVKAPPDLVQRGIQQPPTAGLLFLGPTGSGKTSLAVAMLSAWSRAVQSYERRGAIFLEAAWLARARARHRLGDGEAPVVAEALSAPLLLLDDLGQEREDRDGCITDVIYGRSNASLPTWITCGLSSKEQTIEAFATALAQRYDGGFVRRVLESGKRVTLGRRD